MNKFSKNAIFFKMKVKGKSLSSVRLFATPWTIDYQCPLFVGFSNQEYWSSLPFPPPGYLPNQGSNPGLPHYGQTLYHLSHQGRPTYKYFSPTYKFFRHNMVTTFLKMLNWTFITKSIFFIGIYPPSVYTFQIYNAFFYKKYHNFPTCSKESLTFCFHCTD